MADTDRKSTRPRRPAEEPMVEEIVEQELGGGTMVAEREAAVASATAAVLKNAVAEGLEEIRHQRGCPAKGVSRVDLPAPKRIEVIQHRVSGRNLDAERGGNTDGLEAVIVRCVECGAQYPED